MRQAVVTRLIIVTLAILATIAVSMLFPIAGSMLQAKLAPQFITLSTETTECVETCQGSSCSLNSICYDSDGKSFYWKPSPASGPSTLHRCDAMAIVDLPSDTPSSL